jgi:hypothetical protein
VFLALLQPGSDSSPSLWASEASLILALSLS